MEQRDHYIGPCCFREDLAEWLGERLSSAALPTMALDVYQEDFGWVVDLHRQGETDVIMVVAQIFLTYQDERSDEFGVYVWNRTPGFLRSLFSKMPAIPPENRNLVVHTREARHQNARRQSVVPLTKLQSI